MNDFYKKQDKKQQELYITLLEVTGSLSNLFAESTSPFIYYRAMENIFCKAFDAENLSRSDISADASKDRIGIGLKTFLHGNGDTFQKVAEFNRASYNFEGLSDFDLVMKVSEMRNQRIESTMRMCDLNCMIYHLLTRSKGKMSLYEENMDLIDLNNIKLLKNPGKTTVHFTDGKNEYNFNKSKSTLLKRFHTGIDNKITDFDVDILDDPFDFLLAARTINNNSLCTEVAENDLSKSEYDTTGGNIVDFTKIHSDNKTVNYNELNKIIYKSNEVVDYIVLPLYSPRSGLVQEKSGLNQWNASGRKRNPDEVYISVPSWIHKDKPDFFKDLYNTTDYKTENFSVKLPNRKILDMKIAQDGGKALMSNPNKALGFWILREVLNLPYGKIVTKQMLDFIGVDSVKLSKLKNGDFALDFLKSGSYEIFEENYKI